MLDYRSFSEQLRKDFKRLNIIEASFNSCKMHEHLRSSRKSFMKLDSLGRKFNIYQVLILTLLIDHEYFNVF